MLDQSIMEIILLCKFKLFKERYYCSIQAIMKWCGLTKSSYDATILSW
ncbi:hypothetical protein H5410_001514 [Solanum commersonii]|uniref:Uncharacterized protein n=1 Tax=Solanum commersonii TaxID=4109 RepID=A0A9J6AYZ1_SOLCO|nr:hypothetical protein H5410_001514 [Solanum commersonii]